MSKYEVSIDLLNRALGSEIATSLQYMYFHVHCEDSGYKYLARMFRNISIQEMRHIEELSERILFLEGDVNMNPSFPTRQVTDVEQMLRVSMELEGKTIDDYNQWAKCCSEAADAVSHHLFQDLIAEEEVHFDDFRTELENMQNYGSQYLALQSFARSKSANKHKLGDWEDGKDAGGEKIE